MNIVRFIDLISLFSYCGGPLFIADRLKPSVSMWVVYPVTFFPILAMAMGTMFMNDDIHDRVAFAFVRAGRIGLVFALGMHAYAVWCFARGVRVHDQILHYIGIALGVVWSATYLWQARRWAWKHEAPGAADAHSPHPIEPR